MKNVDSQRVFSCHLEWPLAERMRSTPLGPVLMSRTIQAIARLRSQEEAMYGPRSKQVADRKAHRRGSRGACQGRASSDARPRVRSVDRRELERLASTPWSWEDPVGAEGSPVDEAGPLDARRRRRTGGAGPGGGTRLWQP